MGDGITQILPKMIVSKEVYCFALFWLIFTGKYHITIFGSGTSYSRNNHFYQKGCGMEVLKFPYQGKSIAPPNRLLNSSQFLISGMFL